MTEPFVADIHIHAAHPAGKRLPPRPFSLVRRHYLAIVGYSDGSHRSKQVAFPERDWWALAALALTPPWRKPVGCGTLAASDAMDVEEGLARLTQWLQAQMDRHD